MDAAVAAGELRRAEFSVYSLRLLFMLTRHKACTGREGTTEETTEQGLQIW